MTAVPNPGEFALPKAWGDLWTLGFSVFPVKHGQKRPAVESWKSYQTARADFATVQGWAASKSNIGIATGVVSGLVVLDLDSAEAVQEAERRGLPDTLTVKTGKGLHVYFRHPGGTIGNRAGILPGWDLRGDGGYVVAPGSLHPSGAVYAWENPPHLFDLAPMPEWLVELIAKPEPHESDSKPHTAQAAPIRTEDTPYGLKALEGEVQAILRAGNGEQESTLNAAALKLGALVAGKELSLSTAKTHLIAAGLQMTSYDPGNKWTADAIASKVERGLADGGWKPRSAPEQAQSYREPAWMNGPPAYVEMPEWADTGDQFDPETGEVFEDGPGADLLPTLDLAALANVTAKAKTFAIERLAPLAEVTLFTGPGSAGKSLLGQQLATAAAAGLPCLGLSVMAGPAIYLTCEDDPDQLHWRQQHICDAMCVPMADLAGQLHLISLRGALDNDLATFDKEGTLTPTKAFTRLVETIKATGAKLAFLDNVAHLFTGNENDRGNVTRFVNLLNRLAGQTGAAIVLLGHPNKSGDSYSGSTAWLNAVRSQFTIDHERDEDGSIRDPDMRVLMVGKANYARKGEALRFRWHNWAFVLDQELPADTRKELAEVAKANAENAAFLRCLETATKQRQSVSHNPGVNYYGKIFPTMKEAKGTKRAGFEAAFQRLLSIGQIELDRALWQRENRAWKYGIKAVEICTDPPHRPPAPTPAESGGNPCTDPHAPTPLYTTYNSGAAFGAAAPDTEGSRADG